MTIQGRPDLTYHFLKLDDMEAFTEHLIDRDEGPLGYRLTVIPVYTTEEFSFAINDLAKSMVAESEENLVA